MNFRSNTIIDGSRMYTSLNSQGQCNRDMRYTRKALLNQNQRTPTIFWEDYTAVGEENSFIDHPNNMRLDHGELTNEEYVNAHELAMCERLLYRKRELNIMKLAHQFKQLQCAGDHHRVLKQLIQKERQSRQFLNEEEYEWKLRFPNDHVTLNSDAGVNFTEEEWEKESWGSQSLELVSRSIEKSSIEQSDSRGTGSESSQKLQPRQKSRHCRHFLKGHCERGESCGFRHDRSVFCTNMQKVFLKSIPAHLTASLLKQKLAEQGYTVLNHPKILRCFSSQVCLGSVQETKKLVEKGSIVIDGSVILVRPFEAFTRDNNKVPDEVERSVFLGGLAAGTTADMIKEKLYDLGLKVVKIPVVKCGFSPQVTLECYDQAQTLLKLVRVQINGAMVNIRPFANIRSSSRKKKKNRKKNRKIK